MPTFMMVTMKRDREKLIVKIHKFLNYNALRCKTDLNQAKKEIYPIKIKTHKNFTCK